MDAGPAPIASQAVKPSGGPADGSRLAELAAVMRRLREPDAGVGWARDRAFADIAAHTIEEAYEVADAAERSDHAALADELGDLQLHVVFYARIAEEGGLFTLDEVIAGSIAKMWRRHPQAFGGVRDPRGWEALKADERRERAPDGGALDDVPRALPALIRAAKLGQRAAAVGFDWPDAAGAREKVAEELAELDAAAPEARLEELGDLLFSVVNLARHLEINPEAALRAANAKFEARFREMEAAAGPGFPELALEDKEALWQAAKMLRSPPRAP